METMTLSEMLESDKEMFMANLAKDRSLAGAQAALEKELDRLMYRYMEQSAAQGGSDNGQYVFTAMKSALPAMDSIGEARVWSRNPEIGPAKRKLRPAALAALAAGLLLVLAVIVALRLNSAKLGLSFSLLRALPPSLVGCGLLAWAGYIQGRPEKKKDIPPDVRVEYLADPDKVWRHAKAMTLMADSALAALREKAELARQREEPAGECALSSQEVELFSELLELSYGKDDADSREIISNICFYLHRAGIDAVDYDKANAAWFELLPASRPGTIRPALTSEGKLVKKGMAAE